MESKELVTTKTVNLEIWQTIQSIAPVVQASRMFGVTVQQASLIMLKSYELNLGLMAAFEFIDVINNKPSLKPRGALALIHQSGLLAGIDIKEKTDSKGNPFSCTVTLKRKNGFEYTTTFTMDDAKRAGLIKPNGGWTKYPRNMLRWRALGYCADIVFPDVVGGMYSPEELGADVDADGEPVWQIEKPQAQVAEQVQQKVETSVPAPTPASPVVEVVEEQKTTAIPTLNDLIAKYGPQAILDNNGGRIPGTDEELVAVGEKLEGEK